MNRPSSPRPPLVLEDAAPLAPPASFLRDAEALGVAFEPGELEQLGRYLALLLKANAVMNLTRVVEPEAAWRKHVLDALTLLPFLEELAAGASIADVGSGGGSPGFLLAIVTPRAQLHLVESVGRKAAFLTQAARLLGLDNVRVHNERAETLGAHAPRGALREACDAVVARALGRMAVALELTTPLVRVGGLALFIKGEKAQEELEASKQAQRTLYARPVATQRTPTGVVVAFVKDRPTPRAYPRRPGEPARRPLGEQA